MRLQILQVLRRCDPMNVNEISRQLELPQSTIATNVQALEAAGLIRTELIKAAKGQQKVCSVRFDEIVIRLDGGPTQQQDDLIEVSIASGPLHRLPGLGAVRAVLAGRHHRPAGHVVDRLLGGQRVIPDAIDGARRAVVVWRSAKRAIDCFAATLHPALVQLALEVRVVAIHRGRLAALLLFGPYCCKRAGTGAQPT